MNDTPIGTQIQRATAAELPEIARLAGEIWRAYYPVIIPAAQIEYMLARMYALPTLEAELREQSIRFDRLLVAGHCRGFSACGPTTDPRVYKLHKLYVDPALHGAGYGSLLIRHCDRECLKLGATHLCLNVNKANERALRAYRRNGFAITDAVEIAIGGGFVMDDYVMTKVLTPPTPLTVQ